MTLSFDIASLQRHYADGGSREDVIREVYQRIQAAGVAPVWITLVDEEAALARCKTAGDGPLAGIPFAVKDNIDVAGLPTTCACPAFAYTPDKSATVVERLEAAGAIVIGKANLDQFATGLVGTRSPYGIPTSAFDSTYISGGSSSGSAVAVAKGLVSFALGTDTAGSGRVPAGFNNLVGLKLTKGLISTTGVVPACRSQDVVSIFALTVADAQTVADTAIAFDAADAFSRAAPASNRKVNIRKSLRIGIPVSGLEFFGDDDYQRLYHEAVERAEDLGATVTGIDFSPFLDAAALLYFGPWVAERFAAVGTFALDHPDALHEVVRGIILGAQNLTASDAFKGQYKLLDLIRRADAEWVKMDMLMLPTAPTAYTIEEMLDEPVRLNSNLGTYTNFVNLMDLSALAVPAGFRPDGIPFGVTLIGRAFEDQALAAFGDRMHRCFTQSKLGNTATLLANTPPLKIQVPAKKTVEIAVVGAHLQGQPLHRQLTERAARFVKTARTAPGYRFYALANTTPAKPGLVYDGKGAGQIEVEVWELSEAEFGSFVALIPAPLGIGTLTLDDGSIVKGFICEAHAVRDATDITAFGGWRAWLASRTPSATVSN